MNTLLQPTGEKTATGKWIADRCARFEAYESANRFLFPPLFVAFALYTFFVLGAAS